MIQLLDPWLSFPPSLSSSFSFLALVPSPSTSVSSAHEVQNIVGRNRSTRMIDADFDHKELQDGKKFNQTCHAKQTQTE